VSKEKWGVSAHQDRGGLTWKVRFGPERAHDQESTEAGRRGEKRTMPGGQKAARWRISSESGSTTNGTEKEVGLRSQEGRDDERACENQGQLHDQGSRHLLNDGGKRSKKTWGEWEQAGHESGGRGSWKNEKDMKGGLEHEIKAVCLRVFDEKS